METKALQNIYQQLVTSVASDNFASPVDPDEWSVGRVLAHVIATNRTLSIVAAQLLDGHETSYEGGTISTSTDWLDAIIEASQSLSHLLATLSESGRELVALAGRFDEEAANKLLPATIYDGHGKTLWDGPLSLSDLLNNKLVFHLSLHLKQIQALQQKEISR